MIQIRKNGFCVDRTSHLKKKKKHSRVKFQLNDMTI